MGLPLVITTDDLKVRKTARSKKPAHQISRICLQAEL